MKSLSLVIPTHRRHSSILDLIHSIKAQDTSVEDYEIIIVSNLVDSFFSGQYFLDAVKGLDCKTFHVGQIGVNRARNLGLKKASGELVYFLDDDCELIERGDLDWLVRLHREHKEVLAIGGSYALPLDAGVIDKAYHVIAKSWQLPAEFGDLHSWRLLGGNLSFKRERLLQVGEFFDDAITFGASETELLHRLEKKAERAYFFETLQVLHRTRLSENDFFHKAYQQALVHKLRNLDMGSNSTAFANQTYESAKQLLAWQVADSQEEFDEIMLLAETYNYIFHNIDEGASARENTKAAKKWMRRSWQQIKEVVL